MSGYAQNNDSVRAERLLNETLQHFKSHPEFYKSYNLREIVHYLGRRYLNMTNVELESILKIALVFDDDRRLFPYYQKLHDKSFVPLRPLSHPDAPAAIALESLMLAGLYPDSLPFCRLLQETFKDTMGLNPEGYVRHLAHIALACAWARSFKTRPIPCIEEPWCTKAAPRIQEKLITIQPGSDSWMEGTLALCWMSDSRQTLPDVLTVLEKVRCPGGLYRWDPSQEDCAAAHEHPTVLALWLLCLYKAGGIAHSWAWPED
ncbi:MAG: hypothetical protein N2050_09555 [Flavobacteriales bacterium]|nr:hypothetical protein [Flavobacteriales bacterium]